jgi:ferredoxin-type protein NapF
MAESGIDLGRRALFRGRVRQIPGAIRPPWSRLDLFTSLCTRCNACIGACPEGILRAGDGGFPEVDFSVGECVFCGACAKACPEPVFLGPESHFGEDTVPWDLVAVVNDSCLAARQVFCRSCGESCPRSAIQFSLSPGGRAHAQVDASSCNGCGACVSTCPAGSIHVQPREPRAVQTKDCAHAP